MTNGYEKIIDLMKVDGILYANGNVTTSWMGMGYDKIVKICNEEIEKQKDKQDNTRRIIDEVKKDCNISEHTHLCVRVIPKTDDELISQLRGAQANVIKEIERRLDK